MTAPSEPRRIAQKSIPAGPGLALRVVLRDARGALRRSLEAEREEYAHEVADERLALEDDGDQGRVGTHERRLPRDVVADRAGDQRRAGRRRACECAVRSLNPCARVRRSPSQRHPLTTSASTRRAVACHHSEAGRPHPAPPVQPKEHRPMGPRGDKSVSKGGGFSAAVRGMCGARCPPEHDRIAAAAPLSGPLLARARRAGAPLTRGALVGRMTARDGR